MNVQLWRGDMKRKFKLASIAACILALNLNHAYASDFSLPFVSASGLGNLYADWATNTDDASNAYTNPAGIVRLGHQQLVVAPIGIVGDTQFRGTSFSPSPPFPLTETGTASSHIGAVFPTFYYARPINSKLAFGISESVPFGLGTNYPKDGITRYQSTRARIIVTDVS